ncbi:MAG: hypothetical protein ABSC71_01855 [Candidatus Acidiferrales bacterium]|jgi:hypothetical protein
MAFPSDCKDLNPEHSSKPRVSILRHYDEDMDDTMDIKSLEHRIERGEKLVPLFRAMSAVQSNVYEPFLEFDHKAVTMHRCYEIATVLGVVFGATSVLFAVGGATIGDNPHFNPLYCELGTIALSLVAISTGKLARFKERWILARFKSERLRLLKFASLTHPDFWCDQPQFAQSEESLRKYVECISELTYDDAKRWAKRGVHPYPAVPPCKDKNYDVAMDELIEHYVPKRIGAQLNYMESHWGRLESNAIWTSVAIVVLYWGSFIFVACHIAFEWLHKRGDVPCTDTKALTLGGVFALLALILPIAAAGFRTFRAANEFERSESRHKATYDSLNWLAWEIQAESDRAKRFVLIGLAETVLEADCREFIRLLSEAEWYG